MRDSSHRAALAQLVAIAVAVGLGFVVLAGVAGEEPLDGGGKVVWVSPEDRQGTLAETLERMERVGFVVHTGPRQPDANGDLAAFLVSRSRFEMVPADTWRDLYAKHVVNGGLDVSLHEIQHLARPGHRAGEARLAFTLGEPIFSLLYSAQDGGRGATSSWLNTFDVACLAESTVDESTGRPVSSVCRDP